MNRISEILADAYAKKQEVDKHTTSVIGLMTVAFIAFAGIIVITNEIKNRKE